MNWISTFVNDYLGNVEGSKELKFWTAVQILSISIGNGIYINLEHDDIRSNMLIFIIKNEVNNGKRTSITRHVKEISYDKISYYDIMTMNNILSSLQDGTRLFINNASIIETPILFKRNLIAMLHSHNNFKYLTVDKKISIDDIFLSMLILIYEEDIHNIEESIMSRSIIVNESKSTNRIANPSINKHAERILKHTLKEISELKGSMLIENFILDKEVYEVATHNPRFWNNILKLSMILSISERQDLLITKDNIETAFRIIHDGDYLNV